MASIDEHGPFEAAYTAGVVDLDDASAAPPQDRGALLGAAPSEAFALTGCVLTPERAIENGYVVVGRRGRSRRCTEHEARRACQSTRPTA